MNVQTAIKKVMILSFFLKPLETQLEIAKMHILHQSRVSH